MIRIRTPSRPRKVALQKWVVRIGLLALLTISGVFTFQQRQVILLRARWLNPDIRIHAAVGLAKQGGYTSTLLDVLEKDQNARLRLAIVKAIEPHDKSALIKPLKEVLLKEKDAEVIRALISTLGSCFRPEAVQALFEGYITLERSYHPETVRALLEGYADDPDLTDVFFAYRDAFRRQPRELIPIFVAFHEDIANNPHSTRLIKKLASAALLSVREGNIESLIFDRRLEGLQQLIAMQIARSDDSDKHYIDDIYMCIENYDIEDSIVTVLKMLFSYFDLKEVHHVPFMQEVEDLTDDVAKWDTLTVGQKWKVSEKEVIPITDHVISDNIDRISVLEGKDRDELIHMALRMLNKGPEVTAVAIRLLGFLRSEEVINRIIEAIKVDLASGPDNGGNLWLIMYKIEALGLVSASDETIAQITRTAMPFLEELAIYQRESERKPGDFSSHDETIRESAKKAIRRINGNAEDRQLRKASYKHVTVLRRLPGRQIPRLYSVVARTIREVVEQLDEDYREMITAGDRLLPNVEVRVNEETIADMDYYLEQGDEVEFIVIR